VLHFLGPTPASTHPEGLSPAASGTVGAPLTTYTTFLPCFFYIFIGGPYIEVLRGNRRVAGALTGVTAAIVGVVLNLAVVFGATVIWPKGLGGGTNWLALAMSAAAFLALYRLKADVLWVVLAGGLVGLAATLLFGLGG
jgi:chromate transporter